MTQATGVTKACVRGCGLKGRHLTQCDGFDAIGRDCRGCLPRRADHGYLCWPCHRRLELMLTDSVAMYDWLTANMTAGEGAAAAKDDAQQRRGTEAPPAPVKLDVLDIRDLWLDTLTEIADELAEKRSIPGPRRHNIRETSEWFLKWQASLEAEEWVGDTWQALGEIVSQAHALAPWRPELQRCKGVPCPECQETALVIFGGESDVTCTSCRAMIPESSYGLWTKILSDEAATA